MIRALTLLLCLMGLSAVASAKLTIGPYYIGMTDAQARKLTDLTCKANPTDTTTCRPWMFKATNTHIELSFSNKTRRIIEVRGQVRVDPWDGQLNVEERTWEELSIDPCLQTGQRDEWCYERPDSVRRIFVTYWKPHPDRLPKSTWHANILFMLTQDKRWVDMHYSNVSANKSKESISKTFEGKR
ncbi:MAG: hypothetical protein EON54_04410 [Alcaligenaceae bacterium]|nr:MAG: hypothetical protein EON54_04410 [Alcaligenaceae bacterium]